MAEILPDGRQRISQELIDSYAELSGDYNPLHVDPEAAARSEFGSTIAHGPIAFQPFLVAITRLSGAEALPSGSRVAVRYRLPLRPGDEVGCRIVGQEGDNVRAECVNQEGEVVAIVEGTVPRIGDLLPGGSE
jgi:acyl dehydratase